MAPTSRRGGRFPHLRSWIRNAVDFEGSSFEHVSPTLAAAVQDEAARRLESAPVEQLRPRVQPRAPAAPHGWRPAGAAGPGIRVARTHAAFLDHAVASRGRGAPGASGRGARLGDGDARRRRRGACARVGHRARPASGAATGIRPGGGSRGPGGRRRARVALRPRAAHPAAGLLGSRARDQSPRYRIDLAGRLAPVSFDIEYEAPRYARLPAQHGTSARGDLSALRGTRAG